MSTPDLSAHSHEDLGARKAKHLEICIQKDAYAVETGTTLFDHIHFAHRAIPEVSMDEIDTSTSFFGTPISMPLLISSMTGGSSGGYSANKELAKAAQACGVPVGMGSIRILFRKPEVADHFMLKRFAPDVPVIANIGGVQTRELDHATLIEWIKKLEVQALAVHLNPGQELAQADGDRDFHGVVEAIARLAEASPVPIIAKETGFGIGPADARRLVDAGVSAINVAGRGGTNWMAVERYRLGDAEQQAVVKEFDTWGLPTALLLASLCRDERITLPVVASGGLRNGMDLAKAVGLGAWLGGYALPLIRAIDAGGSEAVITLIERFRAVLKNVMLLTGSRTIEDLQSGRIFTEPVFEATLSEYLKTQTY
ncbi:MAG: type 2 isopentenyl-diphosphate Delta-isomerase [Spirochaetaceae bacterium]|nr:MAG: type 2 isopentenyl-diphosphate Delta-isomerase [Spirochaetaceae bacterium]